MIKISIIVDNLARENLCAEHGLSLLVEAYNQKILFDTAKSDIFLENASKMGIDLKDISSIFLSHNHYDHTGGLAFLKPNKKIYIGKGILDKCYSKHDDNLLSDISMPAKSVEILKQSEILEVENFSEIFKNIYSTGQIALKYPRYNCKIFYKDSESSAENDIKDEQSMLLEAGILITGCCHRGIINTVETCKKHCEKVKIKHIIGGLHLLHCSQLELREIALYLNKLELDSIILLHCTGDEAKRYLSQELNCKVFLAKAGDSFSF